MTHLLLSKGTLLPSMNGLGGPQAINWGLGWLQRKKDDDDDVTLCE